MKRPELLVPAGSPEVLRTAVRFGADAVYIGGEAYGLRAKAKNFTAEAMKESVEYAHRFGVKVYVTANIIAHNDDLDGIEAYFAELRDIRPDGLLVADPGVFMIAKRVCPEIDLHVSTQANNVNRETFRFWHDLGAKRVVGGRELSLREWKQIREAMPEDMEIEAFVHGAMCISYSGRCLLSNFLAGRDANHGECTHPCRWQYALMEETRPGEYFPVEETERGTFIMNSKDLCMITHLSDLLDAGIDSLKIEGRMKTELYVAAVTRAYRRAIDDLLEDPARYAASLDSYMDEIRACTWRPFTTGFYYGRPGADAQIYEKASYEKGATYLGTVEAAENLPAGEGAGGEGTGLPAEGGAGGKETDQRTVCRISQRNKFCVGETIEIMKPGGRDIPVRVEQITDEEGTPMESAPHPQQVLFVTLTRSAAPGDILRRRENG